MTDFGLDLDLLAGHGQDERLVEDGKLGLTFFGVLKAADGKSEEREGLQRVLVFLRVARFRGDRIVTGHLVAGVEGFALSAGFGIDRFEVDLEVLVDAVFGVNDGGRVDSNNVIAFAEDRHGGVNFVKGEGEHGHDVVFLVCFWFVLWERT